MSQQQIQGGLERIAYACECKAAHSEKVNACAREDMPMQGLEHGETPQKRQVPFRDMQKGTIPICICLSPEMGREHAVLLPRSEPSPSSVLRQAPRAVAVRCRVPARGSAGNGCMTSRGSGEPCAQLTQRCSLSSREVHRPTA